MKRPSDREFLVHNESERTAPIRAIIIHTTESSDAPGWQDAQSVANWFNNPASQASAHIIIDAEGNSIQCVKDSRKAWTVLAFNSLTLNVELVGRASFTRHDWNGRDDQLKKLAEYIAYWSIKYDIPIQRAQLRHGPEVVKKGIAGHIDVTRAGYGDHTDPGPNFPYAKVMQWAEKIRRDHN